MKNWKKSVVMLATLVGLAACAGNAPQATRDEETKEQSNGVKVVASIYPLYDWARTLAEGTSIETEYLVDHGDLHSYEPSADDIVKARAASLLLAVGGVDEDLTKLDGVNKLVMTDVVKDALLPSEEHHHDEEEDHDHDHDHEHEDADHDHDEHEHEEAEHEHEHEHEEADHDEKHDHDHEHEHEEAEHDDHDHDDHDHEHEHHHHHHHHDFDEHVWLSPALAKRMVTAIAEEMVKLSPADRERIEKNRDAYLAELDKLEKDYADFGKTKPTLVFADRFPFHYLEEQYGWNVIAAYRGCSADAEVSVDTIASLIDAAQKKAYVLTEARSDGKIAKTVTEGSSVKTITFNAMEAVSRDDHMAYLDIMRENLAHFQEAAK